MTVCPTCGSHARGPSYGQFVKVDGHGRARARHNPRRVEGNPSIRLYWPVVDGHTRLARCPDPYHRQPDERRARSGRWRRALGHWHYDSADVDPATLPTVGRRRIDRRAYAGKKALDAIVHKVAQDKDRR